MKKIFALVLALLLLCGSVSAFAASPLADYTVEQLLALRAQINAELAARGIEKDVFVPIGIYEVGVDIPAGVYTVKTHKSGASIRVYVDAEYSDYIISEYLSYYDGDYIGKLTLKDGFFVVIGDGKLVFSPYKGLDF